MGALGHVAYETFSLTTITIVDAAPGRQAAVKTLDNINSDAAIGLLVIPHIVGLRVICDPAPDRLLPRRMVPLWVVGPAGMAFVIELVAPGDILAGTGVKYALGAAATTALAWRSRCMDGHSSRGADFPTNPKAMRLDRLCPEEPEKALGRSRLALRPWSGSPTRQSAEGTRRR